MKKLKKLTNGFVQFAIGILGFNLIFIGLLIVIGIHQQIEEVIWNLFIYLLFSAVIWLAMFIFGIVVFVSYQKSKDTLLEISGFSEDRFEREVEKAPKIKNVLVCSDAICFRGVCGTVRVVPIQNIVWAYEDNYRNGEYLHIWTKDKQDFNIQILIKKKFGNREAACRYLLRLIARKNKGTLIGYEEEYQQMMKQNFEQVLVRVQGSEIVSSAALEQEYMANNYYVRDFQ